MYTIKRLGKMQKWPLNCDISVENKTATHIIHGLKILLSQYYLYVNHEKGAATHRLYAFSERNVERLVQEIRVQPTKQMPIEESQDYFFNDAEGHRREPKKE